MAKKKKKSGGARRRRGASSGGVTAPRTKAEIAGVGAAYGWFTAVNPTGVELYKKAPKVAAVGKDGTMAVIAHFVAAQSSGAVRKWADRLSVALAGAASVALGRVNFKGEALAGDDDAASEVSGELDGSVDGIVDDQEAYEQ